MFWLAFLILLTAFPIGFLLALLTRDELVSGRKWFSRLASVSLIMLIVLAFLQINTVEKYPIMFTSGYITIICFICIYKSFDKEFVR